MADIAPFPLRSPRDEARHGTAVDGARPHAPGDPLWREHGWGLSGLAVAALVSAVLVASCAVQVLG